MTDQIPIGEGRPRHVGVFRWHSSPSPCSSPLGRGDSGLRAFVSANAVFGSQAFHRKNEIIMEFAVPSPLLWGEEQGEGVSCLRGGAMT